MRRVRPGFTVALLVAFVACFSVVPPTYAASIAVTTTADEYAEPGTGTGCSLREAIRAANVNVAFGGCAAGSGVGNGADTINIPAGTYTLTRPVLPMPLGPDDDPNAGGNLVVIENISLVGAGAGSTIIDGNNADRVLNIASQFRTWRISGLTIQHGRSDSLGGAIYNGGALTITDSELRNNTGRHGGAIFNTGSIAIARSILHDNTAAPAISDGGAILHQGVSITITDSTFRENRSASRGGAIAFTGGELSITGSTLSGNSSYLGGAISFSGAGSVRNSTLSGNTAAEGGAIFEFSSSTTLSLIHSTFSGNSAPTGGSIRGDGGTSVLQLRAVLFDAGSSGANCAGPTTTQGSNVADDASCFANAGTDKVAGDVGIGMLASNGGPTRTHALLAGSPAIDAVQGPCTSDGTAGGTLISTDQRGTARPTDGDGNNSVVCDAGSHEKEGPVAPTISAIADLATDEDIATSAIPFSINDADSAVTSLEVTTSSDNQALVPNDTIQLGGSGHNRTIRLAPAANQHGSADIDVAVSDGTFTTHETFTLTVNPVNDAPVAVDDSYSTLAGQQLTVPAAMGVLANDTDVEGGPRGITSHTNTSHGYLILYADGAVTYTPASGFSGTDTFTYRATDSQSVSNVGTVTITVNATVCEPRGAVQVSTSVVNGKLQATVTAQTLATQGGNRLVELRFGAFQNGLVTLNGRAVTSGATYTVPANTAQVTFTVQRVTAGQPTTIPLTAVDLCGSWPTFVGGGTGAGF